MSILSEEEQRDLVRDADLDWQAGFPVGEETNRYSALIQEVERTIISKLAEMGGKPGPMPSTDWQLHMPAQQYDAAWTSSQEGYTEDDMLEYARTERAKAVAMVCIRAYLEGK